MAPVELLLPERTDAAEATFEDIVAENARRQELLGILRQLRSAPKR